MIPGQRGAVTYMMAVIMLLICTLVTAYTMRNTVLWSRLSANSVQAEQVMAVAQAGLAEGLVRLVDVPPLLPKSFSGALAGQGVYRVRYAWRQETAPQLLDVISAASASDGANVNNGGAGRVLTERAIFQPWLADMPSVPLIARGAVRVAGRAVLAGVTQSAPLIWSGGAVIVPAALRSGVVDRDRALRALNDIQLMEAVFARHPAQLRALVPPLVCAACDLSKTRQPEPMFRIKHASGRPVSLWTSRPGHVDAAPAIVFVDGDLVITRPLAFNGVLFVTGSVVIDHEKASISGVLIAGGDVALRAGRLVYAANLIETLRRTGYFLPLSGSRRELFEAG